MAFRTTLNKSHVAQDFFSVALANQTRHITELRAMHHLQRNRVVERDELAAAVNSHREKTGAGALAMAQQVDRLEDGIVRQTGGVGPEIVVALVLRVLTCAKTCNTDCAYG
jgi:hypothetical protein